MGRELDILGALILALDIYAIWLVMQESWSGGKKILWIVLILLLPVLGMLLYMLFFRTRK